MHLSADRMRENTDRKNFEYGHFSRSELVTLYTGKLDQHKVIKGYFFVSFSRISRNN